MTSNAPTPQSGIMDIKAYVPGKSAVPGDVKPIKLSSNETPLGPSPRAIEAYSSVSGGLSRYPDGDAGVLRDAIAARFGLNPQAIVCGAGSDELLSLLAQGYLGPGDEAIYTEHGFLMYPIAIMATGATPIVAPESDLTANVDAILERVTKRTKLVFLANPNNPTGTYLPFNEVARLREKLPGNVLLILDAAYAEYVRRNDYEAGLELVATTDNTVMTRTFSKIHGLAALRLGWAYCPPDVAGVLNRIRGPFNVSAAAIAAGAAAISDAAHTQASIDFNEEWLTWTTTALEDLGLTVTPSVGNFLLVHFPDDDAHNAHAADAYLLENAIIVRRMDGYGLPGALRITIGLEAENRALLKALARFMSKDPSSHEASI